jgi:hypothetical protein
MIMTRGCWVLLAFCACRSSEIGPAPVPRVGANSVVVSYENSASKSPLQFSIERGGFSPRGRLEWSDVGVAYKQVQVGSELKVLLNEKAIDPEGSTHWCVRIHVIGCSDDDYPPFQAFERRAFPGFIMIDANGCTIRGVLFSENEPVLE